MIPTSDNLNSLIVLTGYKGDSNSLYQDVSMALQAMSDPQPVSELWLPQFKVDATIVTNALNGLTEQGNSSARQSI